MHNFHGHTLELFKSSVPEQYQSESWYWWNLATCKKVGKFYPSAEAAMAAMEDNSEAIAMAQS